MEKRLDTFLLSSKQAAGLLGISEKTLRNWRSCAESADSFQRRIPYIRVGGRVFYNPAHLDDFIKHHTHVWPAKISRCMESLSDAVLKERKKRIFKNISERRRKQWENSLQMTQ